MISRISKISSGASLLHYLTKPTKNPQIVDSSIYTPEINSAIASQQYLVDPSERQVIKDQVNRAMNSLNSARPDLHSNVLHLVIAFDPNDGELSPEFKGQIAREMIEGLGYGDTYWAAFAHGREDPEHDHIHGHDHLHILSARVGTDRRTISDSHDFGRARQVLAKIEQDYQLTPFVPFWEREYITPEIQWCIEPHPEQEIQKQQSTFSYSR